MTNGDCEEQIFQSHPHTNNGFLFLFTIEELVGNVSGYRWESDCRSRGREFDPGPVPYFRDHEIISTVILLPSAESFKKGCQLQAKVCARSTG